MTLLPGPPRRLGIIGGMGPMAGVYLQRLIIEATPALKDQEHFPVICFTNPQIPDRTASLHGPDGGDAMVRAIQETGRALCAAGANLLVIPCHTAHARFDDIQHGLPVPVLNIVRLTVERLTKTARAWPVGLMATTGTRDAAIYQREAPNQAWVFPHEEAQECLMRAVYDIKGGKQRAATAVVIDVAEHLRRLGAETLLLGCTELSLCDEALRDAGHQTTDPLQIVAQYVTETCAPQAEAIAASLILPLTEQQSN